MNGVNCLVAIGCVNTCGNIVYVSNVRFSYTIFENVHENALWTSYCLLFAKTI